MEIPLTLRILFWSVLVMPPVDDVTHSRTFDVGTATHEGIPQQERHVAGCTVDIASMPGMQRMDTNGTSISS